MAKHQIADSNGTQTGAGQALAGIVLGAVTIVLTFVAFLFFLITGMLAATPAPQASY